MSNAEFHPDIFEHLANELNEAGEFNDDVAAVLYRCRELWRDNPVTSYFAGIAGGALRLRSGKLVRLQVVDVDPEVQVAAQVGPACDIFVKPD